MATQKGKGVVFGVTSTGFAFGATASGASALGIEPNSQTIRQEAEITRFKDADGDDVGAVVYNQTKRLTLNAYPSGTTLAAANTANNLPTPGQACVITDGTDTEAAGNWMVESCEKAKSNTEITTFTLELVNAVTGSGYHDDAS
tara:strand:- start:1123 stop:1554 length:432 start_codon:yes stop_codon:yes gene_type:complete